MARKPAQKTKPAAEDMATHKPEGKEDAAVTAATAGTAPDATTAPANNEGAKSAEQSADARNPAPGKAAQGQIGEEGRSDLLATIADAAGDMPMIPAGLGPEIIGLDLAAPEADLAVVCHRKDGRRRGGRKWSFGETRISSAALTDYQLAQLQGDPAFTVFYIEKE